MCPGTREVEGSAQGHWGNPWQCGDGSGDQIPAQGCSSLLPWEDGQERLRDPKTCPNNLPQILKRILGPGKVVRGVGGLQAGLFA